MAKANVVTGTKAQPTGIKVEKAKTTTNNGAKAKAVEVVDAVVDAAKPKVAKKAVITPAELASTPAAVPAKKAAKVNKMGKKDKYGFGEESETSFLINKIETGKYTRAELLAAFIQYYCVDKPNPDKGGEKRKKTSFSVFFSDVKKPFGTYHASRSLIINEDPKTNKLSLDAKRMDAVTEAIGTGILNDLKGKNKTNHPGKINAILKTRGLPLLLEATK
jgi:hypothetical protein